MSLALNSLLALKYCLPAPTILSLGYPDILATQAEVEEIFGVHVDGTTNFGRWHGVDYPLPETLEFMQKIGSTLKCVDIVASRGCEEICDLNHPHELGKFDLVIDGGTIEHCFQIGTALLNAANAVKVGGRIMHGNPLSMMNHGFYNLCPTLMWDFYKQNGWEFEQFYIIDKKKKMYDAPPMKRFIAPNESSLFCLVKRPHDKELKYPMQAKYIQNPTLS